MASNGDEPTAQTLMDDISRPLKQFIFLLFIKMVQLDILLVHDVYY
jgi:hypothetical protein